MLDAVALFQTLNQKLDYISVRHTLIAQNVAHADTPGFEGRDLKPFAQAMREIAAGQLQGTNTAHLTAVSSTAEYREDRHVEGWELEPSGNGVNLEEQMIEAADSARDYKLTTTLINKHLSMLRAALRTV